MKDIKKLIYRELIIRQNEKIKNLQLLIKSTTDSRKAELEVILLEVKKEGAGI